MRADRLLALVLLLQHRGRMSAAALARELEVSQRTVLRDVEALSAAGVPVYAERGRTGGFALLPGYSTDLTGLTHDEALALLVAGSRTSAERAGMAPALASAMRKVVAALPDSHRTGVSRDAERLLVEPDGWLPGPGPVEISAELLDAVRGAVFAGRRLRVRYAARAQEPRWRIVDPIGLVSARGAWYLFALRDGAERTYRLSRMVEAVVLDEPARRPADVDLGRMWQERRAAFVAGIAGFSVRVRALDRAALGPVARFVSAEHRSTDGGCEFDLDLADIRHAERELWPLAPAVEVLEPSGLRDRLAARAAAVVACYRRA